MPREVLRPERYQCPVCGRYYGELMNTGVLSEHHAAGGDGYTLCRGSRESIEGLPTRQGASPRPLRTPAPHIPGQGDLFSNPPDDEPDTPMQP